MLLLGKSHNLYYSNRRSSQEQPKILYTRMPQHQKKPNPNLKRVQSTFYVDFEFMLVLKF
ncbi:hypothetical protein GLOIN_2v1686535 [Rhizophagus irregularis DAOM 181602=DAOM 197198]|uniref:Uncharacterized protein n=1 Tax=Rhizophagus irregularis (strain DAOM 181602 / DAOM 197198 / MUCL 43194) TaxID=747089 RepID=A0A2P4PDC5_RHIID|nr:hypothetical protein GLOIN_2v1686535 [Rhizophagus irregularis DAOM 181602=DAOM 197198]POG63381.1 hypothetical protein GLOIN_2v1686535 [Rhizophagus irregularis DAOM 181602=DAOM 197198]|eukprot:XP_025170247.1 hypothetical protein GLOIN_2v1686535 [Rhizophagus irregularis DAOM 181602=DAOM 197198]